MRVTPWIVLSLLLVPLVPVALAQGVCAGPVCAQYVSAKRGDGSCVRDNSADTNGANLGHYGSRTYGYGNPPTYAYYFYGSDIYLRIQCFSYGGTQYSNYTAEYAGGVGSGYGYAGQPIAGYSASYGASYGIHSTSTSGGYGCEGRANAHVANVGYATTTPCYYPPIAPLSPLLP